MTPAQAPRCRIHSKGYIQIRIPSHPRASSNGYVYEHIVIAEQALGHSLPPHACVHHVNEQPGDNQRGNHVICENNAYHKLLHLRLRAYRSTGHAAWLACGYCQKYDAPDNLYLFKNRNKGHHLTCQKLYTQERKELTNARRQVKYRIFAQHRAKTINAKRTDLTSETPLCLCGCGIYTHKINASRKIRRCLIGTYTQFIRGHYLRRKELTNECKHADQSI